MPRQSTPDLDLSKLHELAVEKPQMTKTASSGRLKFAEHNERFSKIGFDLFRDSESEFIWKLEKDSETGEEFIIRTANKDSYNNSQSWSAEVNQAKSAITLIYRGHAVKQFKKADVGFSEDSVEEWRRYLVDKITTDPSFLNKVITQVGESRRKFIFAKFPELKK